jgi:hypothetical protein
MKSSPETEDATGAAGTPLRAVLCRSIRHRAESIVAAWSQKRVLMFCLLLSWFGASVVSAGTGFWEALFDGEEFTAVNAKEFNGYVRTKLPGGSYQRETYVFGNGGILTGNPMRDPTLDDLSFLAIAHSLAEPLASQNYLPASDPKSTELLVMVYWGTTFGAGGTMIGLAQDQINWSNASLLGFETEARFLRENGGDSIRAQIIRELHASEMSELEVNRYFVILRAFDFQSAWKQKNLKLRWETRFSLSERRHGFERDLSGMAKSAALYFGQDSYGLVQRPLVREGHVILGEPKVLGFVDDETGTGAAESASIPSSILGDWQSVGPGRPPVIVHIDPNGHSTFENPSQHAILPARVSVAGNSVTVIVPGWDISLRGTRNGGHIFCTISEYGKSGPLSLTKSPKPISGIRSNENSVAGIADRYPVDRLDVAQVTQHQTPEGKDVVVEGTYILKSVPKARIALSVTTDGPIADGALPQGHNYTVVSSGQGKFVLDLIITGSGSLHVSFYPMDHGEAFGTTNIDHVSP